MNKLFLFSDNNVFVSCKMSWRLQRELEIGSEFKKERLSTMLLLKRLLKGAALTTVLVPPTAAGLW